MTKLLKYELKRLLLNKFYLALLVITLIYSHRVLTTTIILGIADTAPFSSWSFGYYLSQLLPILSITILFFITFQYSSEEKKVQTIISATPINPGKLVLIRCGAMGIGYLLQCILIIACGVIFHKVIFEYTNILKFLPVILLVLLPAFIFVMGIGLVLGKIHSMLLYLFMAVCIGCSILTLPYMIDPFGANFFTEYPIKLGTIEPSFSVPVTFWINRFLYTGIGLGSFYYMITKISGGIKPKKKNQ